MYRWHAFTQLVLLRFRDFYREPEVILWAYGFPLILTVALGIAFAGSRPEPPAVDLAGAVKSPEGAAQRPSGLAVAPDGSLYVSDDIRGRIYRIVYRGGADFDAANITPCPSLTAPAGKIVEAVRREQPAEDVAVAIVSERAVAITPEDVVVDVVIGIRPEQRAGPAEGAAEAMPITARRDARAGAPVAP